MIPVGLNNIHVEVLPPAEGLAATAARRRWLGALAEIRQFCERVNGQDAMSQQLIDWFFRFQEQLRLHPDADRVAAEFLVVLDEILVDSLSELPLTEETVLGSDGETYLPQSIDQFWDLVEDALSRRERENELDPRQQDLLNAARERPRRRSPLHLDDPALFNVREHPVVPPIVQWRNRYIDRRDPLLEEAMRLQAGHNALVDEIHAGIDLLIQRMNEFEQRQGLALEEGLGDLHHEIDEGMDRIAENIERLRRADEEALAVIRNRADGQEERGRALDEEIVELQQNLGVLGNRYDQMAAASTSLIIAIKQCQAEAAKKKKKSWKKAALVLGGMLLGCGIATALMRWAGATGLSIFPTPSGNGVFLKLATPKPTYGGNDAWLKMVTPK